MASHTEPSDRLIVNTDWEVFGNKVGKLFCDVSVHFEMLFILF